MFFGDAIQHSSVISEFAPVMWHENKTDDKVTRYSHTAMQSGIQVLPVRYSQGTALLHWLFRVFNGYLIPDNDWGMTVWEVEEKEDGPNAQLRTGAGGLFLAPSFYTSMSAGPLPPLSFHVRERNTKVDGQVPNIRSPPRVSLGAMYVALLLQRPRDRGYNNVNGMTRPGRSRDWRPHVGSPSSKWPRTRLMVSDLSSLSSQNNSIVSLNHQSSSLHHSAVVCASSACGLGGKHTVVLFRVLGR